MESSQPAMRCRTVEAQRDNIFVIKHDGNKPLEREGVREIRVDERKILE